MSQFITGYPRPSNRSDFYIQDLGTAAFFGIEFIDTLEDLIFENQNLTCKPNILIEGSTILLDYENCTNQSDKDYIQAAFTSMGVGMGFTLTSATYRDAEKNYTADLGASCTFNSYVNYKVLGTISSIGSTSETNYYLSSNFETIPQIGTTAGVTSGITSNGLINYTTGDSTSFIHSDFATNDYIDFSTSSNTGRFVIQGITVDNFNREVITFSGEGAVAQSENLKGTEVIVNRSRKVYRNAGDTTYNNIITYTVSEVIDEGDTYIALDGIPQKNIVLTRGTMYVFIDDFSRTGLSVFSIISDISSTINAYVSDIGLYSIIDTSLNRTLWVFVPNNTTPNTLYYTGSGSRMNGGSISIVGAYTHSNTSPQLSVGSGSTSSAPIISYGS